jgi:hypothetical protein
MRSALVVLCLAATVAAAATADAPDVNDLVARMKAVLEPPQSSVRKLDLTINGDDGSLTKWVIAQARKTIDGGPRMLTVVLAPAGARGIASIVIDGTPPETALYTPTVRRVRTLVPQDGYDAVLGSDFTYFDLGFVRRNDAYRLAGAEQRNGKDAWKIEQIPASPWYYSKIVAWIDETTMLPIERDYFGPTGELWKVQKFDKIVTIDGHPVATHITMQDTHTGGTSEIQISKLRFDVDLPDSFFERAGLRQAASSPILKGLQ